MGKLILKETKNGSGVFASKNFGKGEKIVEFKGGLFTFDSLPTPYNEVTDHYAQIGKNLYLGPSGGIDDYFNHSCDPNSGLKIHGKTAVLAAIKSIAKGSEIFWDYSTTMDEDEFVLDCACSSRNCRGKVSDFKYLPEKTRRRYIHLGIVPKYIIENL